MKNIIVAGAGHGGLTLAYNLAQNGCEVTVYEKEKRKNLGHDWHDTMVRSTFERSGVPAPDDDKLLEFVNSSYTNPSMTKTVKPVRKDLDRMCFIDRRELLSHLIEKCEEAGVKFVFEINVVSAYIVGDEVRGIITEKRGRKSIHEADLTVDACGIDSPIRRSLPKHFGVEREIADKDRFFVWRGYFKRTDDYIIDPPFAIYFYHCGKPGMDWALTEKDFIDILVGGFGSLSEEEVKRNVEDFRRIFPDMTDKIIRGGEGIAVIPLRKMLSQTVCNGCACVGDSACMTEPLSGSGITLSMLAGKILADVVIDNDDCSVKTLWKYHSKFFRDHFAKYIMDDILKNFLSAITPDDVDYFIENGFLGEKELGSSEPYVINDIIEKVKAVGGRPKMIASLSSLVPKIGLMVTAVNTIPKDYSKTAVERWKRIYKKI